VLVEPNKCHIKSEAILRIAKLMGAPYPALAEVLFPLPDFFRDLVYDRVTYFVIVAAFTFVIGWFYLFPVLQIAEPAFSPVRSGVRRLPIAGTTSLARPTSAS